MKLLSAADAVADIAARGNDSCQVDLFLEVTDARLTEREVATTRGPAVVPVWELVFVEKDKPTNPITHIALDQSDYLPVQDLPEMGQPPNTEWAVGSAESSELIVVFGGAKEGEGPCTADYTGQAIESDLGVVVIVTGHSERPSPRPTGPEICPAVGYFRNVTVALARPLGYRTVLDHWSGWPVALYPEMPEGYPRI